MILGISGLAGSGKDTFAKFLAEDHEFTVLSLADPLKRICREVFAFTDDQLWGPSEKRNQPDPRYPRQKCAGCQTCAFTCDHYYHLTPRYALQQLGTEWGRDCYPNIWVEYAMRTAATLLRDPDDGFVPHYNRWRGLTFQPLGPYSLSKGVVIPDVRFRNEIEGIRAAGGKVVRIRREQSGLAGDAAMHASEREQAEIPDSEFDLVVQNDGTLEELRAKAADALPNLRP